jgi:hypothetical protein
MIIRTAGASQQARHTRCMSIAAHGRLGRSPGSSAVDGIGAPRAWVAIPKTNLMLIRFGSRLTCRSASGEVDRPRRASPAATDQPVPDVLCSRAIAHFRPPAASCPDSGHGQFSDRWKSSSGERSLARIWALARPCLPKPGHLPRRWDVLRGR